jgi:ankyrin repeat protein
MSSKNNNKNNSTLEKVIHLEHLLLHGKKKEAKDFLKNGGIDINSKFGHYNRTILMDIIVYLDKDSVELILEEGADINAKDKKGETALDYALDLGKKEIIELLLKYGAKEGKEIKKYLNNNNNKNKNNNKNNNKKNNIKNNKKNNTRRRLLNRMNPSLRKINLSNTRKVRRRQKN